MSPRRAPNRDANEGAIVKALRKLGAKVERLDLENAPDLLVGFRGRNWLLEVKNRTRWPSDGKLSDGQRTWHQTWPGQVAVVTTEEEALDALRAGGGAGEFLSPTGCACECHTEGNDGDPCEQCNEEHLAAPAPRGREKGTE